MKYEVHATAEFSKWLKKLKNQAAKKAITTRILRLEAGLLGDRKTAQGRGFAYLRETPPRSKPYRVYYTYLSDSVIIILFANVKTSKKLQAADMDKAEKMAKQAKTEYEVI